ncbi:uncharacterized protein LOC132696989 [Cylas formicarius]|uniref:uncharacterized protein LOC132696989 n=1 Tax=Cylas formicarius TaxID=197179 RepID=UPI002958DD02|nr:uncharacterized protein LOC132696989 [Cylas formicarius]
MANSYRIEADPAVIHSSDTPKKTKPYNLAILTEEQQQKLIARKLQTARENQKYLFQHPEIRATIHVITKKILIDRPSHDIEAYVMKYVSQNWMAIMEEVARYVESVQKPQVVIEKEKKTEPDAFVTVEKFHPARISIEEDDKLSEVCRIILEDVVDKAVDMAKHHSAVDVLETDTLGENAFAKIFGTVLAHSLSDDVELDLDFNNFQED